MDVRIGNTVGPLVFLLSRFREEVAGTLFSFRLILTALDAISQNLLRGA